MAGKNYSIRHVELIHMNAGMCRVLKDTRCIISDAVRFVSDVVMQHWDLFENADQNIVIRCAEQLIHETKQNPSPLYDFDTKFPKMPCYIRRAVIMAAFGSVSSYKTRLSQYETERHDAVSNGKHFHKKAPTFNYSGAAITMYRKNTFKTDDASVYLKVYMHHTWKWIQLSISSRDRKDLANIDPAALYDTAPSVVYKNHKYYLMFPIKHEYVLFPDVPLEKQRVLGVDLGINHGAVASVVDFNGNVSGRYFDPFHRERKEMDSIIARIRILQRKSGSGQPLSRIYQKLDGIKDNYVKQLSRWVVDIARKSQVYDIVLEHLGKMKARGHKKDRIHHWCKCRIRDYIKGMALRYGIRVFLVNPKNTSSLAFDGSGKVVRDEHNFSKCMFANGKQYHCDLSASYNIASRYFIRTYLIHTDGSDRLAQLKAVVPELAKRTNCTLSTLWRLSKCLVV